MPHQIQVLDPKRNVYLYLRDNYNDAGQNSYNDPPSEPQDQFELLKNVQAVTTGTLQRRWGTRLFGTFVAPAAVRLMQPWQSDLTGVRKLIAQTNASIYAMEEDGTGSATVHTNTNAVATRMVNSRDYGYFTNGTSQDSFKWNGTATSKWGIAAPITAISVGTPTAGAVTLSVGRKYYAAYRNTTTKHSSDLNIVSASSGAVTSKQIPLSNIPVSSDPQVDKKWVLATADGGDETTLYLLAEIPNAQTTYNDNTPDDELITKEIALQTDDLGNEVGVSGNLPPAATAQYPTKHRGRIFMLDGQLLRWSKDLVETITATGTLTGNYEECWPAEYQMDISEGAETPRGLLSDGDTLYVGTERHVYRILGSGPDFDKPELAFNEVGIVNQDVWKVIFLEGTPIGTMWLTPDKRVIASDFSSYHDMGDPIQDVLNSINSAATSQPHAQFLSSGAFNYYILSIPTGSNDVCDTVCAFDLKNKAWFVWQFPFNVTASFFTITATGTPLMLVCSESGKLYKFDPTIYQDKVDDTPAAIAVTIKTPWLHLDNPVVRKLLNELEVVTSDPNLLVTIEGASDQADFDTPHSVVTNAPLVTSPFGQYKVYLAGRVTNDRYYRFTFTSSANSQDVLALFKLYVLAGHNL